MTLFTTKRLTINDRELARQTFGVLTEVFEGEPASLSDSYLDQLLRRTDFWGLAALRGDEVVGGITAHTLPMTRSEASELFIYDVAVLAKYQRQGVGRLLLTTLCDAARAVGIQESFVPADNEDTHALDFYRALGGEAAAVTIFTFGPDDE